MIRKKTPIIYNNPDKFHIYRIKLCENEVNLKELNNYLGEMR